MFSVSIYDSPLGPLVLRTEYGMLSGVCFEGQRHFTDVHHSLDSVQMGGAVLLQTCRWLDAYFSGSNRLTLPPLHLKGTPFRQLVWSLLLQIPYGETVTYGELARRVACLLQVSRMSSQAVGNAVGYNPIALLVPCHRVVGADGSLTGYAAGVQRKKWLLDWEMSHVSKVPKNVLDM